MDLILSLQKELGSIRGLPADMQYVKNAMAILSEVHKQQSAEQTLALDSATPCHNCTSTHEHVICSVCGAVKPPSK
jgi:hypothetical protein